MFSGFDVYLEASFAVVGHRPPGKPRDCRVEQVLHNEKLLNDDADEAPEESTEDAFDGGVKGTLAGWMPKPAGAMSGDDEDPGGGAEHDKNEWKVERQSAHVILLVNSRMDGRTCLI